MGWNRIGLLVAMLSFGLLKGSVERERLQGDGRYRAANAALGAPRPEEPRVVFIGDSITEGWTAEVPGFFTAGRVGRGISGETTARMLARFGQDAVALRPAAVHIMGGTNDVAGNDGPASDAEIQANVRSMVELAEAHGIRVILASIPPAGRFPWRPGPDPAARIGLLNDWLRGYATERGAVYADYWTAMRGEDFGMREGLSVDGVHPNGNGYAVMMPVAEQAIRAALETSR